MGRGMVRDNIASRGQGGGGDMELRWRAGEIISSQTPVATAASGGRYQLRAPLANA